MKYFYLLIILLFIACQPNSKSNQSDSDNTEFDSLQKEITTLDSLVIQCKDFEICLKELEFLAKQWVKEQKTSDSQEKMKLLEFEKKCLNQLQKIEDNAENELKDLANSMRSDLDSALLITKEIRNLLPDFESYEDINNLFFAQVLVDEDGDLRLVINRLTHSLRTMLKVIMINKERVNHEIKKNNALIR